MQGVAIGIFLNRVSKGESLREVFHGDLFGLRQFKQGLLQDGSILQMKYVRSKPQSPFYVFQPQDAVSLEEYQRYYPTIDMFLINSTGIKTHRDNFVLDFDKNQLSDRIDEFRDSQISDAVIRQRYSLNDTRDWKLKPRRRSLGNISNWESFFTSCYYRPFDLRPIYFHSDVVELPRNEVMFHIFNRNNLGLIFMRQAVTGDSYSHFGVTNLIIDNRAFFSNKGTVQFAPLYLYPNPKELFNTLTYPLSSKGRSPNFRSEFIIDLETQIGLQFITDGQGNLVTTFGPEDILLYAYAFFHSSIYRQRYAEFLKMDFPRLPLTSNLDLFRALVSSGGKLVLLHLMEFALEDEVSSPANWPRYPRLAQFSGSNRAIEKFPSANRALQDGLVAINPSSGFTGVREDVWNFQIGGYQVCHKWLKDRNRRTLTDEDILHYCKIVTALHETIRLMAEIDEVIDAHGGWPIQ